jgi:hypothetical protein
MFSSHTFQNHIEQQLWNTLQDLAISVLIEMETRMGLMATAAAADSREMAAIGAAIRARGLMPPPSGNKDKKNEHIKGRLHPRFLRPFSRPFSRLRLRRYICNRNPRNHGRKNESICVFAPKTDAV